MRQRLFRGRIFENPYTIWEGERDNESCPTVKYMCQKS